MRPQCGSVLAAHHCSPPPASPQLLLTDAEPTLLLVDTKNQGLLGTFKRLDWSINERPAYQCVDDH